MYRIKFGTDGWRGVIADDFTFDNVKIICQAIADYVNHDLVNLNVKKKSNKKNKSLKGKPSTVVIGYDKRFLSEKYAKIAAGVMEGNGISVLLSDKAVTSPMLSYAVVKHKAALGIMVTASHNPPFYNGIKVKANYGGSISMEISKEIEKFLYKNNPKFEEKNIKQSDFYKDYIECLKKYINLDVIKKARLKIVFDPMHGSGESCLKDILQGSKCELITIHEKRDAMFGWVSPEPIEKNLEELKKRVILEKADLGIAVDGDGDRVGIVDNNGNYLPPHHVFPLILLYLIEGRKWAGKIVQAVSLGYLGERIAKYHKLPFQVVSIGFKYVCDLMLTENILMGGEESGGFGYQGYIPERDGVLSSLWVLEMLAKSKNTLSQINVKMQERFGRSVFKRKDIKIKQMANSASMKNKLEIDKKVFTELIVKNIPKKLINMPVKEIKSFDGVKIILEDDSWLLIRPSGTEPVVRLYSEAGSLKKVSMLINNGEKIIGKIGK